MKIAILCPREPWYPGGQERVVANTVKHLKNHFDIEIFCTGEKNYEKIWDKVPVHVFKGFTKAYRYSPQLKKEFTPSEFDIIHAHGFTIHSSFVASKKKNSASFIINPHFHEVGSTSYYRMLRMLYDPIFGKRILNNADRIICVSNIEKEWLQNRFNSKNKIAVIPNGIDIDKINGAEPYDIDGKLILYIGRLERYKNIHILIKTMKHLPEEYSLNIIGNGDYKRSLLKLTRQLNLEKRVKIFSNLEDEKTYKWLNTCDLFVNFSDVEAFGITVLEALCAGKPVIVNNKGGLAELARSHEDCVFQVNIDSTSLEGLGKLIKEKSTNRIRTDLDEYQWKNISKRLGSLYNNILKEPEKM
jgi:glycosyltransferase involved in cell wall biosynthesis